MRIAGLGALAPDVGCSGSAEAPLLLARALDSAAPGDWIVVGGFGEGADVLLFRATAALVDRRAAAPTFSPDGLYFLGPRYDARWSMPTQAPAYDWLP